jgi:hypothetical protein
MFVVHRRRMGSNKYPLATLTMRNSFNTDYLVIQGMVQWCKGQCAMDGRSF